MRDHRGRRLCWNKHGNGGGYRHDPVFAVKPGSNTGATDAQVAKATIPVSTAVGSEFTTRDGTAVFIDNTAAGGDDYRNAGKRVFPKGTLIRAVWVGGADTGTDADVFACYADAEEFGAAPAVG